MMVARCCVVVAAVALALKITRLHFEHTCHGSNQKAILFGLNHGPPLCSPPS